MSKFEVGLAVESLDLCWNVVSIFSIVNQSLHISNLTSEKGRSSFSDAKPLVARYGRYLNITVSAAPAQTIKFLRFQL